ncbi:glycosyl transferase family 1 [Vulcanimicrobium alpinum]|uniref:Glycosyl transferase family 1 n=1 Tax=Vulcanimicrobium alpinum TaxID=3016050 RepID=A0AAN2C9A8_UNVUL|nr:glycosyltransferase family 1 protein [Vulcanimicrobium alpinum]BDE06345.1 glycosyl transferase family 1 [Vulcanimicrobium alpinum]
MIRVVLAARATSRASMGMRAYTRALLERLPHVAPDVDLVPVTSPVALHPLALRAARPQLVHLAYLEAAPLVPRPYVAMVHDLLHLRFPHLFSPLSAWYWRTVAIPLYRGAARILVSDERVAGECVALLGIARERIRVMPLGFDERLLDAAPWEAERPYAFYAGNHRPHKGLATLYEAWAALPDDVALDLVLTGPDEPAVRERYARRSGTIVFLGDLDEKTLARRYRGALACVLPSLAEGFGIPALEAAAVATPVIATATAVPSIVAPYAQTFEAGDAVALASLLCAIVRDPYRAREAAAEGAVRLRAYTWDRFAASTAAVYREVVCS